MKLILQIDINDVAECEVPEDVKEYLQKACMYKDSVSVSDLSYASSCYMKAAEKLQNIGKLEASGKYYDRAADVYAQTAQLAEQRDRRRNDERIGKNWWYAYSCYTRARAAYTQFGFNRYSVGRI